LRNGIGHFADESVFVDSPAFLSGGQSRGLGPHFLHILQHHVAVAIEGFDTRQEFAIVATGDEDLGARAHGGLKD
jgi:hypothetical protein